MAFKKKLPTSRFLQISHRNFHFRLVQNLGEGKAESCLREIILLEISFYICENPKRSQNFSSEMPFKVEGG
jgi:hypothetical protein